ncbi:MAG: hypothetical protein IEMM0008_0549 [bacterium]|nr:MAG: hypothetical protein IEMM0008_0549 [bacterium]
MMKNIFVLGLSAFLLLWVSAINDVHGQTPTTGAGVDPMKDESPNNIQETLIDFTQFEERIQAAGIYPEKDPVRDKRLADLDVSAGSKEVDPDTLAPAYEIKASDLRYNRWLVQLNSSANSIFNRRWSYAIRANIKGGKEYKGEQNEVSGDRKSIRGNIGKGKYVLGVRIHFPERMYNAYARISPPYEFRAYTDTGRIVSRDEKGKFIGILDNVGTIKKITIDVSGRNYKNGIAVRLKGQFDNVSEHFMGYTYFINWRRMTWKNPNYITSVDHRTLFRVPLYPREVPYKKFDSIIVYRPGQEVGGDFIVYFRKIDMWFDFAVPPELLEDVDIFDETEWGILSRRARARRDIERKRFRERVELMRYESIRMRENAEPKNPLDKNKDKPKPAGTN